MKNGVMLTAVGSFAALLMLLGATHVLVSGQEDVKSGLYVDPAPQSKSMEGVWRTVVTVRNCQTGDPFVTFQGLSTYNQGGTMSETAASSSPLLRSGSHGVWKQDVRGTYDASFIFLRFNSDGTYAGTQKTTLVNVLTGEGNTYDSTASIEVRNPSGNIVFTGCATATGTRFE